MKNVEIIKQMNAEQMAEFFAAKTSTCELCAYRGNCGGYEKETCEEGIKKHLESEADK